MSTMAMDQSEGGTDLPAGTAPPPPPPQDHAADRVYPPAAMAEAREEFREEQGGRELYQIMFNLAEVQVRDGKDAIAGTARRGSAAQSTEIGRASCRERVCQYV